MLRIFKVFFFIYFFLNSVFSTIFSIELQLAVTSDIHGWLSTSYLFPKQKRRGLLHIKPILYDLRKKYPDIILLDAGDFLEGSYLVTFYQNSNTSLKNHLFLKYLQMIQYDAIVLGNHDFEYFSFLQELTFSKKTSFPLLAANIKKKNEYFFPAYKIITRKNLKIAILGLTTPGTKMWIDSEKIKEIEFESVSKNAKKWISFLKEKENPDVIIALVHMGVNHWRDFQNSQFKKIPPANGVYNLIRENPEIDLVISGHDHKLSPNKRQKKVKTFHGVPIIEGGKWGEAVQFIQLEINPFHVKTLESISVKTWFAKQDKKIDLQYNHSLPKKYKHHLQDSTKWKKLSASKKDMEHCLQSLIYKSFDLLLNEKVVLSKIKISQLDLKTGEFIKRKHIIKWIRYDNKMVKVLLNARELFLIANPKKSLKGYKIPYNRKLQIFPPLHQEENSNSWFLKTTDFFSLSPVYITNYHFNGGGGVFSSIHLHPKRVVKKYSENIREHVFKFLKLSKQLPENCFFLKKIN